MKRLSLFTLLIYASGLQAQMVRTPVSVLYPSTNTYSTQFKDAFSFRSNTAALAGLKDFSAGVFSESRFLLQELSSYALAIALPTSSGSFGLSGDYCGNASYNENAVGLGYARSLGPKADVGVQFHYYTMSAAGYGTASAITFSAGALFHLTDALQAGVHMYNPVAMKIGKSGDEKLPAIYSAGLGYDVSPQLFIGAEVQKTESQPLAIVGGMHYQFADKLMARAGINSATSVYYLGFGVQMKRIRIDATTSFHPYLGITPGLLFVYSSKQ